MAKTPSQTPPSAGDDRRQSPRVPMRLLVRLVGQSGEFETREGDLSLGGIAWLGAGHVAGDLVEVRFWLPGAQNEMCLRCEVLRVSSEDKRVHARFVDVDVQSELAIAKYLDDLQLASR